MRLVALLLVAIAGSGHAGARARAARARRDEPVPPLRHGERAGVVARRHDRIAFAGVRDRNAKICSSDECRYAGKIYTSAADGGDPRRLTENEGDDADPRWSPDGTRAPCSAATRSCPRSARSGGRPMRCTALWLRGAGPLIVFRRDLTPTRRASEVCWVGVRYRRVRVRRPASPSRKRRRHGQ